MNVETESTFITQELKTLTSLLQILEKTKRKHKNYTSTFKLFSEFSAAYDSVRRWKLFQEILGMNGWISECQTGSLERATLTWSGPKLDCGAT